MDRPESRDVVHIAIELGDQHGLGHLPARWPWQGDYINALNRIRALPVAV